MLIDKRTSAFVIDTLLAFLAFVGALHVHMGSLLWSMPPEVLLKYGVVLSLLFLGIGLWTSIPEMRHVQPKALVIYALFVGAVHILYWPCTVLMGRYYPLPTKLFLTSSAVLFVMLVSWRLLFQLSSSLTASSDKAL